MYQADVRLEHLLLEKEIKDIIFQSESSSELSLIEIETQQTVNTPAIHNKLLETIVYRSIAPVESDE